MLHVREGGGERWNSKHFLSPKLNLMEQLFMTSAHLQKRQYVRALLPNLGDISYLVGLIRGITMISTVLQEKRYLFMEEYDWKMGNNKAPMRTEEAEYYREKNPQDEDRSCWIRDSRTTEGAPGTVEKSWDAREMYPTRWMINIWIIAWNLDSTCVVTLIMPILGAWIQNAMHGHVFLHRVTLFTSHDAAYSTILRPYKSLFCWSHQWVDLWSFSASSSWTHRSNALFHLKKWH